MNPSNHSGFFGVCSPNDKGPTEVRPLKAPVLQTGVRLQDSASYACGAVILTLRTVSYQAPSTSPNLHRLPARLTAAGTLEARYRADGSETTRHPVAGIGCDPNIDACRHVGSIRNSPSRKPVTFLLVTDAYGCLTTGINTRYKALQQSPQRAARVMGMGDPRQTSCKKVA